MTAKKKVGKIQQNVDYIKSVREEGRDWLFKSELPYPKVANGLKAKAGILHMEGNRIYLTSRENK